MCRWDAEDKLGQEAVRGAMDESELPGATRPVVTMPADKAMELQPGACAHGLRHRAGLPATTHGRGREEGADPRTTGAKPAFTAVRDTRVNTYMRTDVHGAVRGSLC